MKVERVHDGIRYTLSNECLHHGDEVYPVAQGRQTENGWIIHNFDFRDFMSGFPADPHIIKSFDNSHPKEKIINTNKGYSFSECYYKIIKCEKQVQVAYEDFEFAKRWVWVEIDKPIFPQPWICNQCNSEEYSGSVSEADIQNLACSNCGGVEFHRNNK
jgi:hypothetical protein